jgi:glyoxylase-like metal-dependent hydrolase (beta-lactamase superfamily II)
MPQEIKTISLLLPYRLGKVNCYLIVNDTGYVLIDTGSSNKRNELERELESSGCKPGSLNVIVLTHGDFDHTGNAAYLREKFGTKIAIHYDDSGIVEYGNMFWNREKSNVLIRMLVPVLSGFGKSERFKPDLYLKDGDNLSQFGFEARVLQIPGHSKGSIGVMTADGNLFCGDLLSGDKPALNSIVDSLKVANASLDRLKRLSIKTVYPGHGKAFLMEALIAINY